MPEKDTDSLNAQSLETAARVTFRCDFRETAWRAACDDELQVACGEGKALKTRKPKDVPA
jgi:hypothetical protein